MAEMNITRRVRAQQRMRQSMKNYASMRSIALCLALAMIAPGAARAATAQLPNVKDPTGYPTPAHADVLVDTTGTATGTPGNPIYVSGGGGGGGAVTQSGTWNVGISGTLPAFAATPTFNIGTAPSLTIGTLPALPTGSNAIGSITNSSFGISGTLPAFASAPTVNIGTSPTIAISAASLPLPSGAATSANQATANTSLAAIQSAVAATLHVDTVVAATATDRGAVIGTSATQLMAANSSRRGIAIQVQSATANCWINGTAGATSDYHSLKIPASTYYETPPGHTGTGAVSIICDTASTSVYAREW